MSRAEYKEATLRARDRYDALPPGARAKLKRCRTADDLLEEGVFWRLVDDMGIDNKLRQQFARVVLCFPYAEASHAGMPFPRWLRTTVYGEVKDSDLPTRASRFRRALAARDRDELAHELRRLLQHGFNATRRGVEWGELGADIIYWGDAVRRRWAQQFFTRAMDSDLVASGELEERIDD